MMLMLIMDEETSDRLRSALMDLPQESMEWLVWSSDSNVEAYPAGSWRFCVGVKLASCLKTHGWTDSIIVAISREQFDCVQAILGPRDALVFDDVPPDRARAALTLAVAELTLFPHDLMPQTQLSGIAFERLSELTGEDWTVMAMLTLGLSNRSIARELRQPPEIVSQSVVRICRVLRCSNRTNAAVLIACRLRPFIDPADAVFLKPKQSCKNKDKFNVLNTSWKCIKFKI